MNAFTPCHFTNILYADTSFETFTGSFYNRIVIRKFRVAQSVTKRIRNRSVYSIKITVTDIDTFFVQSIVYIFTSGTTSLSFISIEWKVT